jgi:glycerol-3-phosphate dehydrogenase (NAD(P)+)
LCKGVERETLLFPHQVVSGLFNAKTAFGVLSGPSFAQEVARGLPCALVLASEFEALNLEFVQKLSSQNLRIYHSTDVIGVELGGAHKNVLAIAAGISDGLQLGMNARAALLTRGIAEMRRFANALGANADTISGLAGVGDLILTATGDLSRNRMVGLQLAQGKSLHEISTRLGHVAEGALCANAMLQLAERHHIKAPITQGVCAILAGVAPNMVLEQLLLRTPAKE